MCWDTIVRFNDYDLPKEFFNDYVKIANDEAKHFTNLNQRLKQLGSYYGELPAHNQLWENANKTIKDLKGRIFLVNLVQEAKALDSHERLVQKVGSRGDKISMKLVDLICKEEIDHVKKGVKWFKYLCKIDNTEPISAFHNLAKKYLDSPFFPPFNKKARNEADLIEEFYLPLASIE